MTEEDDIVVAVHVTQIFNLMGKYKKEALGVTFWSDLSGHFRFSRDIDDGMISFNSPRHAIAILSQAIERDIGIETVRLDVEYLPIRESNYKG